MTPDRTPSLFSPVCILIASLFIVSGQLIGNGGGWLRGAVLAFGIGMSALAAVQVFRTLRDRR